MNHKLMRLMALNHAAPRAYRIEAAAGDEATVYLYDVIGADWLTGGGVTAKQFADDLRAIKATTLHLRINSPGGDVFEGRAMVAALQAHPARKIAHVDGLAASAASFLIMHADEIEITDGAFVMIHNGWTVAMGDRHTMTETVALLEKIDGAIADDYQRKTGADRRKITEWMDAETWFTAAEAIEHGFADRIAGDTTDAKAKAKAKAWNLAAFDHAPAALAASQAQGEADPASTTDADYAARLRRLRLAESCLT